MSETALDIRIRPGIPPGDRHQIEDTLERKGMDVAGGGGDDEGQESDIMVYADNPTKALATIRKVLQQAKVGPGSVILQSEPQQSEHPVYTTGDSSGDKLWWKFW